MGNSQTVVLTLRENQKIIDSYVDARKTKSNVSQNFQTLIGNTLGSLSRFTKKNFKRITRDDLISFLNSLRKSETDDPNHKWIGTYNLYLVIMTTFFKWLFYPDMEPKERPKPDVIQNIKRLGRKEKSTYKPSDMWTQEDDILFLKYCPSKRDRAYHMMSRDTSCRPSEILNLKKKDVVGSDTLLPVTHCCYRQGSCPKT